MQDDFDRNFPTLKISVLGVNENGQDSGNSTAVQNIRLPLLQDVDTDGNSMSDVWHSWDVEWRDVWVLDAQNNSRGVLNLTQNGLSVAANYANMRSMIIAAADRVAANEWQSPIEPLDTNRDEVISPLDALLVINKLGIYPNSELPDLPNGTAPDAYVDVTGDGLVTPIDALLVINQLTINSSRANGIVVEDSAGTAVRGASDVEPAALCLPESSPAKPRAFPAIQRTSAWWADAVFADYGSL